MEVSAKPYARFDTVLCQVETDSAFLSDIREVAEKRQAARHEFFDEKKKEIQDFEIDYIHEQCLKHAQSNILNQNTIINSQETHNIGDYCECGCMKEMGGELPLCLNEQKISVLGSGVLLVFFYLRHIRLLVFLCFLIYGSFCVITNVNLVDWIVVESICERSSYFATHYCQIGKQISFYAVK